MTTPRPNPPRNSRQHGAAMLIMVLIMILGLIALFAFRMDRKGPELDADRKTALALAQAKEALLGNSATNNIMSGVQNPGRFLCPNIDNLPPNEGKSALLSGSACQSGPGIPANMGRLPWWTLKMDDLRDGAAERLWYVVDPSFVDNGTAMNTTITPSLAVNGNTVVAVIIAPGPALGALNQQRDTANQNNYGNYLESYINSVTIALNAPSTTYNDRMITITTRELFTVVTFRMAKELAGANGNPPYSATSISGLTKTSVWNFNQWDNAIDPISSVSPTSISLKFQNCASIFTIKGPNSITRNQTC